MKLAIMQPYLFPYIGYFQLINAVDKFVVYDDVNFIKQGWINRNNILVQGKALLFTVPLENASSFAKINEIELHQKLYQNWKVKFLRTVEQSYKKAPFFDKVFNLIQLVFDSEDQDISKLATTSIIEVCRYLDITTQIVKTSSIYGNDFLSGKERVIDICKIEDTGHYINPIGGVDLYNKDYFNEEGIQLNFIKSLPVTYQQFTEEFIPWLSIIDSLMFNQPTEILEMTKKYELV